MSIIAFTDGACSQNGQPGARGGYAVILAGGPFGRGGKATVVRGPTPDYGLIYDGAAAIKQTPTRHRHTNNRSEFAALIACLCCLRTASPCPATVYTDSDLMIKTLAQYYPARQAKGRAAGMANIDMIETASRLLAELRSRQPIELVHVKGHGKEKPGEAPKETMLRVGNQCADAHAGLAAVEGRHEVLNSGVPLVWLLN